MKYINTMLSLFLCIAYCVYSIAKPQYRAYIGALNSTRGILAYEKYTLKLKLNMYKMARIVCIKCYFPTFDTFNTFIVKTNV